MNRFRTALTLGVVAAAIGIPFTRVALTPRAQAADPLAVGNLNWTTSPPLEGTSDKFNATISGGTAPFQIDVLFSDGDSGTTTVQASPDFSINHVFAQDTNGATGLTRIAVRDADGTVVTGSLSHVVANVAPTVQTNPSAITGHPGDTVVMDIAVTDPGTQDPINPIEINWGDGQTESITTNVRSATISHTYAAKGDFTATLRARDDDAFGPVTDVAITIVDDPAATTTTTTTTTTSTTSTTLPTSTSTTSTSTTTTSSTTTTAPVAGAATTSTTSSVGAGVLSRTGNDSDGIAAVGAALLLLGGIATVSSRRRRPTGEHFTS